MSHEEDSCDRSWLQRAGCHQLLLGRRPPAHLLRAGGRDRRPLELHRGAQTRQRERLQKLRHKHFQRNDSLQQLPSAQTLSSVHATRQSARVRQIVCCTFRATEIRQIQHECGKYSPGKRSRRHRKVERCLKKIRRYAIRSGYRGNVRWRDGVYGTSCISLRSPYSWFVGIQGNQTSLARVSPARTL